MCGWVVRRGRVSWRVCVEVGISSFFCSVFFKFGFYYWYLSFSLKSDIDVTVQPHFKMFGLCATTRVMCVRHLLHDWDTTAFAPVPCWAQPLFQKGGSTSSTPPLEYLCFPSSFAGMVLLSSASFLRERIDLLLLLAVSPSSLSFEWHSTPIVHVWDVVRPSRFSACDSCSELSCVVLCRSTVFFSDKQHW